MLLCAICSTKIIYKRKQIMGKKTPLLATVLAACAAACGGGAETPEQARALGLFSARVDAFRATDIYIGEAVDNPSGPVAKQLKELYKDHLPDPNAPFSEDDARIIKDIATEKIISSTPSHAFL
jgi:hypothetical protein